MAKKKSGISDKKTTSNKGKSQKKYSAKDESGKKNPEPVEKIKVQRNRRRLYQAPAEGEGKSETVAEKPTAKKSTSKRKKPAQKRSTAKQKKNIKTITTSTDTESGSPVIQESDIHSTIKSSKLKESNRIVEKYSVIASGSVLLPVPVVDIAYITGVQLKMISDLSKLYGVEFKKNRGKSVVTSLLSGILNSNFMFSTAPFLVRYIPVVGYLMAPISIVLFSSALTYSVGKVFIQHFEAGGTFLNFKPAEVRAHFRQEFENKYQAMKDDS